MIMKIPNDHYKMMKMMMVMMNTIRMMMSTNKVRNQKKFQLKQKIRKNFCVGFASKSIIRGYPAGS